MPLNSRKSKAAVLLIAVLAVFSLTPLFFASGEKGTEPEAVVTVDGEIVRRVPLAAKCYAERFTVSTPYGENHIAVVNGAIHVEEADCPAKICVKSGAIKNVGEVIACLPHKLLIEIKETRR